MRDRTCPVSVREVQQGLCAAPDAGIRCGPDSTVTPCTRVCSPDWTGRYAAIDRTSGGQSPVKNREVPERENPEWTCLISAVSAIKSYLWVLVILTTQLES